MRWLRFLLAGIWLTLLVVTWHAAAELGLSAGTVFFDDFAQPWRAQFNSDLMLHLLLFAVWVVWREPSRLVGLVCAVLCSFGGIFTFAYLLAALHRAHGDLRVFMLGKHAQG